MPLQAAKSIPWKYKLRKVVEYGNIPIIFGFQCAFFRYVHSTEVLISEPTETIQEMCIQAILIISAKYYIVDHVFCSYKKYKSIDFLIINIIVRIQYIG